MLAELAVFLVVLIVVWGSVNIKSNENTGNFPPGLCVKILIWVSFAQVNDKVINVLYCKDPGYGFQ